MGVRTGLAALVALPVVAVLAVDPGGAAPFGPTRWWLISTLALLGGGLVLRAGTTRLHRPTLRLWWGLIGLLTISALVNDDVRVALLGHPVRHLGLVTWLLCLLLFAAGQQLDDESRRRLALGALAAMAGTSLWCAWELVFGRPVDVATQTRRLLGPLGSASMLGAACCLLVPVVAAVAVDRSSRPRVRVVAAIATIGGLVSLVGSGSRAAIFGALVAAVTVGVVRRPDRRTLLAFGAAAAVAVLAVAPRLSDVLDRPDGAGSRFDEWALGLDVIADHPVVGVGPEGYRIAVMGHVDETYERAYGRDVVLPDRIHLGPLDVAANGGVLAGVVYAVLIGWVVIGALRRGRRGDVLTVGVAGGLVAYAAQQLLLFRLAELDPLFWLLAGTVVVGFAEETIERRSTRTRSAIGATALIIAMPVFVAGLLGVAADRLARTAITVHTVDGALRDVDRAIRLRPDDLTLRSLAVRVHLERGTLADVDAALRQADAALRWSANDPIALDDRATVLLARAGVTGSAADALAAVDAWHTLVTQDPTRARWLVQWGRAAALAGDEDTARTAWTRALDVRPDDPTARELLDALDRS